MKTKGAWRGVMARGVLLWLGVFTLVNLLASWAGAGVTLNSWWIDLRFVPGWCADAWLAVFAAASLAMVCGVRSRVATGVVCVTAGVVAWNAAEVYRLHFTGAVRLWAPVPMSAVIFVLLAAAVAVLWRERRGLARKEATGGGVRQARVRPAAAVALCARYGLVLAGLTLGFALGQMALFGQTDYARKAEAIVVLGARAYADGQPSDMLRDRVMTGVRLYHAGVAPVLVFTGGPGDGAWTEPEAMRRLAVESGVPEGAIVMDEAGLSTRESARNVARMGYGRVVLVSHGYHLPRTRMLFEGAGVAGVGVPARVRYTPGGLAWFVGREVASLVWNYCLLVGRGVVGEGV